jgi:hypothetical protein
MRRILNYLLLLALAVGCKSSSDEPEPYWGSGYKPILMERTELEKSIIMEAPADLISPAKIYVKGSYIFISEKFKGVHVIDNHNPSKPDKIGFIRIPGCVDMAIKGNILYADNAVDLVSIAFDSTNWGNLQVTDRIKNVFPEITPPDGDYIPSEFSYHNRPDNTIIVGWKLRDNK